jgi:hypothetical protein
LTTPQSFFGTQFWIDVALPAFLFVLPVASDGVGLARVAAPLVSPVSLALVGFQLSGQFFWFQACVPTNFTASPAFTTTFQ